MCEAAVSTNLDQRGSAALARLDENLRDVSKGHRLARGLRQVDETEGAHRDALGRHCLHLLDPLARRRERFVRIQRLRRSAAAPREPSRVAGFEHLEPGACEELAWLLDDCPRGARTRTSRGARSSPSARPLPVSLDPRAPRGSCGPSRRTRRAGLGRRSRSMFVVCGSIVITFFTPCLRKLSCTRRACAATSSSSPRSWASAPA